MSVAWPSGRRQCNASIDERVRIAWRQFSSMVIRGRRTLDEASRKRFLAIKRE